MQIQILYGDQVIGSACLNMLDPPMGTAAGSFQAGPSYKRMRHATHIEGSRNTSTGPESLSANTPDGEPVDCVCVFVEDYTDALDEIEVTVFGIARTTYDAHFRDHPHYKEYYDKP